ncbi:MAG: 4'-phosphopantetheinyl transferase family protein [Halothece sp.]
MKKKITNNKIIDIWKVNLDISPQLEEQYWSVLNQEEKERASRFVKKEHQTRFIAGRGVLRYLIGDYLNLEPEKVEFAYLTHGKPLLAKNNSYPPLQFNVSHSHHLGLYAFAYSDDGIGIDLELIRPISNVVSLAKRFFTEKEASYLESLSPPEQIETFFQFWTAKEAYLKATGEGLVGLDNIEVMISASNFNPKSNQLIPPTPLNKEGQHLGISYKQVEVVTSKQPVTLLSLPLTDNFVATVACLGDQPLKTDLIYKPQSEKRLPLLPSDACHYLQLIVTDQDR